MRASRRDGVDIGGAWPVGTLSAGPLDAKFTTIGAIQPIFGADPDKTLRIARRCLCRVLRQSVGNGVFDGSQ